MNINFYSRLCSCLRAVVLTTLVCLTGCSPGVKTAQPVDSEAAVSALKTTLDAWKANRRLEELQSGSPPIVVQDFDWLQNKQLLSYEITDEPVAVDANLLVEVKIKVADDNQEPKVKSVTYIVGTDPVLTVFRQAF